MRQWLRAFLALAFLLGAHGASDAQNARILLRLNQAIIPNFDTNTGFFLNNASQIGTAASTPLGGVADSKTTTVAFWSLAFWDPTVSTNAQNNLLLGQSPTTACEHGSGSAAPGYCFAYVDASGSGNFAQFNINDSSGTGATSGVDFNYDTAMIPGVWTFNIIGLDTHNQVVAQYRNRTKMVNNGGSDPAIPLDMVIPLTNGAGLGVMNRNSSHSNYMMLENFYLSTESVVCISSSDIVLNGNHFPCPGGASTIPPTILDKFIDSSTLKAISLGSDGSVVTGRQPEILLSGNAASSTTNKGFATGLALQPAVGNANGDQAIWEAPYGPGQTLPAHHPTSKWVPAFATGSTASATFSCVATSCTFTASTGGQPVAIGDLIVIEAEVVDGAAGDHSTQCPAGFTSAAGGPTLSNGVSANICYQIAAGTGTTWLVPFTNSTSAFAGWVVMDYTQVASIDVKTCAATGNTATWTTPTVSTASNNETVLSIFLERDNGGRYFGTAPATIRFQMRKTVSGQAPLGSENFYASSGSATAKSATFASGTDQGVVCSLGMVGT